jgi:hypothetical protein
MTLVAKWAIGVAGTKAAARFEAATRSVAESQRGKLKEILQRNAATEYGAELGFGSIDSLADYARAVPVVTYEDIAERVKRMAAGESNVLTAEAPVMFTRTSGTTGEPKLIPVTPTCRGRDHADQMRTWLYHAQQDHPGIFRGRVISLVSPAVEGRTQAGIPYGSASGAIYRDLPRLVKKTYAIPYDVFAIEDYAAKYYVLMRLGLASDVSMLCTANPSSVVKLCEFAQEHADELVRDVHDGTLSFELELTEHERQLVLKRCRADRGRADALEAMRKRRGGQLLPADYWPSLEMIGCWKGGTVGSYVERFGDWFDPDGEARTPVRDLGYLSSEARGSIPLSDEGSAGVLTVGTNVYEFVEVDQLDAHPRAPSRWEFLGAHEIEAPRDYYVFVTTTGGLYRYDINDIIRVEAFHNEAPIITFQRKGRGMTSITGEKLSDTQIIEAVKAASAEARVDVAHFRALADSEQAHYVFQVEPQGKLSETQGRQLLAAIDGQLSNLNLEYKGKRSSLRLQAPELHVMKPGWYERGKQAQGGRLFQSKTVLLKAQDADADELSVRSREMCVARIKLESQSAHAR